MLNETFHYLQEAGVVVDVIAAMFTMNIFVEKLRNQENKFTPYILISYNSIHAAPCYNMYVTHYIIQLLVYSKLCATYISINKITNCMQPKEMKYTSSHISLYT